MSGYPTPTFASMTLPSSGNSAVTTTPVAALANIAALQALGNASVGGAQLVEGYTTAGDGGGGVFVIGTTTTANGGTIINDALGRSWYRVTSGAPYSVSWFGAIGNGTTNDTAAVESASGATSSVFTPIGSFSTTIDFSTIAGAFWGPGHLIDSAGNSRGKYLSVLQAPPSSLSSNMYSINTVFDGDYSHQNLSIEHRTYGTSTLGTPTTGFDIQPQSMPFVGYVYCASGHMQNNSTGDGQTGGGFAFINIEHHGQGNQCGLNMFAQSYGTNPSATNFLAYPSIGLLAGQATAGATGTYLNPIEVHNVDNGFDSAAINYVATLIRSNSTGANNASWEGFLAANQGSANADSAFLAQGHFDFGLDLTPTTLSTQGAIVITTNQRIYFGGANSDAYSNTTSQGESYIVAQEDSPSDGHDHLTLVNDTAQAALFIDRLQSNVPIVAGGEISPLTDNTYSLGDASFRFTAVWAVNGTIQTSDPSLKTDVAKLPSVLPLVLGIDPVTFKWKSGGFSYIDAIETQSVPATETISVEKVNVEIRNGVAVSVRTVRQIERPIFDDLPLFDESGNPIMVDVGGKRGPPRMVQKMHRQPRMVTKEVPIKKRVEHSGARTHWGFLAPEVKAGFDKIGVDFGGYVKGDDGIEGLRPDQLIPVLWKAVQELKAEIDALKSTKA